MALHNFRPPHWPLRILRWILPPEIQEEIEGDLTEKFHQDVNKLGIRQAVRRFYRGCLSILKLRLIFNLNLNLISARHWIILTSIAALILIISIAPFMPGTTIEFSHSLAQFIHASGYLGLFILPLGMLWLIIEMRNEKNQELTRWTNGYYLAWLTLTPLLLIYLMILTKTTAEILGGSITTIIPHAILIPILVFLVSRIQKLKHKANYYFNAIPLYIVIIPLITIFISHFIVENVANLRREKLIILTEPLITAIEKYKTDHGIYPEQLNLLQQKYIAQLPTLKYKGVNGYHYKTSQGSFQLSFEQLWHWNATDVTMYSPQNHVVVKGNYDKISTRYPNWYHYLAD